MADGAGGRFLVSDQPRKDRQAGGIDDEVVSNIISTCPPIRSRCAWLLPLYGMWMLFVPAARSKASPARCWVLPTPEEAYRNDPGFSFISFTNSPTLATGTDVFTSSTLGTTTTRPTGCRSLSGSKPSLRMCGAMAWPVLVASSSV